ncbi:tonB-dependent receptor [Bacteroides sp. CAG:462]|nr:tonB-dependent receptor [Bacteroides sp. CAG:462]
MSDALTLNAGIRVDRANLHVHRYRDWFLTPVADADSVYKERSPEGRWTFCSLTWSVGGRYVSGAWTWKANVGKSFRVPQPQEVGADGVNYHVFRYEKGMPDLQPEESYQLDAGMAWRTEQAHLHLEPFLNYFPNYIYLLPTAGYTEGLQTYVHTQSRVFRWGFEAGASYWVLPRLEVGVQGEYLYAVQLSGAGKGTALPFSPPWRAGLELKYVFPSADGTGDGFVGCSYTLVGRRNRIVPPELPTAGYGLVNVSAGKAFAWKGHRMSVHVQGLNLLGKRYYDATSYYRLIDVPGPGRQFSVLLGMEL